MDLFKQKVRISNSKDESKYFDEEYWGDTGAL